jgi:DNA polymerase-4
VVGGDESLRHGIVLAANQLAKKKYMVRTGETLFAVRQRCRDLVVVPPNHSLYLRFARLTREIYGDYTDQVEPFGLDEAFLDVTGSEGETVANTIRERVKEELGITVSVGVSFNKPFAKLGSDYKKPDATTVFDQSNWKEKIWPMPVGDLIYVGPATAKKLQYRGVHTIGDLAKCERRDIDRWLNSQNGSKLIYGTTPTDMIPTRYGILRTA